MGIGQFVIISGVGGWPIDVYGGTAKNTVPRFLFLISDGWHLCYTCMANINSHPVY